MNQMMYKLLLISCAVGLLAGCGREKKEPVEGEKPAMPFERVAAGDEDPGDNGPGDDTELNGVPFSMGAAKFKHFTHASNSKAGFGIPCVECHHNVADPDDSGACSECHRPPAKDGDAANWGPDDNMVLVEKDSTALPVPFNHFTHASASGFKIACASCHHKDDYLGQCSDCHGVVAKMEDGKVVPKLKRAFHMQCKGCHEALVKSNPQASAPVSCDGCHREGIIPRAPGALPLQRAYHQSCIGCHLGVAMARPDTKAPTSDCSGCHPDGAAEIPKAEPEEPTKETEEPAQEPEKPAVEPAAAADAGTGEAQAGEEAANKGAAEIKLSGSDEGKKTKAFKHHAHHDFADSCKTCHHEGLDEPSCIGACHEPSDAKKIFHKQCRDCHKENGVDDKCSFCHE